MSTKNSKEPIGAFIIVINNQTEKILLGKRRNGYLAGYFGFPGGRIEKNEKILDCAERELIEETGLIPKQLKLAGIIREYQSYYNFIHFAVICRSYCGKVILKEPDYCEKWTWFSKKSLPKQILPGHKAGIEFLDDNNPFKIIEIL